jgi:hypothetical protein
VSISAKMNREHLTGLGSPRRRPRLARGLPLLHASAVLAPQPAQLFPLVARQAHAAAVVGVGRRTHLRSDCGDPKLASDMRDRAKRRAHQREGLTAELLGMSMSCSWHWNSFLDAFRRKRSSVHESGGKTARRQAGLAEGAEAPESDIGGGR